MADPDEMPDGTVIEGEIGDETNYPQDDDTPVEESETVEPEPEEPEPEAAREPRYPGDEDIDRYEETQASDEDFQKTTGLSRAQFEAQQRELEMLRQRSYQPPWPPYAQQPQGYPHVPPQQQPGQEPGDDEEVVMTGRQLREMEGRIRTQTQSILQRTLQDERLEREATDIVERVLDRYGVTQKGKIHRNTAREELYQKLRHIPQWDEERAIKESVPIVRRIKADAGAGSPRRRLSSPPVGASRGGSGQRRGLGYDPNKREDREKILERIEKRTI